MNFQFIVIKLRRLDITVENVHFFNLHLRFALNFIVNRTNRISLSDHFASLEETLALRRRVLTKSVFLLWCFLPDSLTPSVDGSTAY
ncbi:hypothetical protein T07_4016 [Trichinella nelsoni]|uniref:Uncharacterized protein n=1 Tax=Trichinella nelsoni TaxID=6336 RepID=A0A0V0SJS6_9BILA|nr:hypothetical protein T07_4016 [Trichinella nelsoni]